MDGLRKPQSTAKNYGKPTSPMGMSLLKLTEGYGVYRQDLLDVLTPELRTKWGIASDANVERVRELVVSNLKAHLAVLRHPSADDRRELFIRAVAVMFSIYEGEGFRHTDKQGRRAFLRNNSAPRSDLDIAPNSINNYVNHACNEIEKMLDRGWEARVPLDANASTTAPLQQVVETPQLAPSTLLNQPEVLQAEPSIPVESHQASYSQSVSESQQQIWHEEKKKRRGALRRHPYRAASIVVVGLVIAAGLTTWRLHVWPFPSDATPQTAPKPPQESFNLIPSSTTHAPPVSTSPPSIQYLPGDSLNIAYDDMNSEAGGSSVAFTTSQAGKAAAYVNEYNKANSSQEAGTFGTIMAGAMAAGAYSYGQLVLTLQFTTHTSQPVQIFNIRALVQSSTQVATGAVIDEPGGSGQSSRIAFDLDDRTPFAKVETNGNIGGLYFGPSTGTIDVTPNDPKPKLYYLDFQAQALAHTFEVAIDYNMGGKRYTQLLSDQNGSPLVYRVTGRLCDSPSILDSTSQQQFRQAKYGTVYYQQVDGNGNYILQPSDPAAFITEDHCN